MLMYPVGKLVKFCINYKGCKLTHIGILASINNLNSGRNSAKKIKLILTDGQLLNFVVWNYDLEIIS